MTEREREERRKKAAQSRIITAPQGSWTGVPLNPDEIPVQDADDL